jgi:chaperone LolA
MIRLFLIALAAFLAAAPNVRAQGAVAASLPEDASQADSADASGAVLLRAVQQRYEAAGTLTATFTQTLTSDLTDGTRRVRGRLQAATGNRFRVDMPQETLVSDGQTTWVYNDAERQVLLNDYREDDVGFSPEDFFRDFTDRYDVVAQTSERRRGMPHTVLTLRPTAPDAGFRTMRLWVRDDDRAITKLRLDTRDGATITFVLTDVVLGADLPPETFTFEPPEGAEVVDLR